MAQDAKETHQPATAQGPTLPELIRYDGPPELADAWQAFARHYAATASRNKGAAPFSRFHIEQVNLLNELAFGEKGVTGFLERRRIMGSRKQLELPAIPSETGPTATIAVRALDNEAERRALDQARRDIEPVALALAEATASKGPAGAQARDLFNRINDRLMEQWIEREKAVGLYPPLGLIGDIPQAVRLRRQALLGDVEGKLLSGTLYSLQTPILVKAGYELFWNKLGRSLQERFSKEEVIGDALAIFTNALFSYEAGIRRFTSHVIGAVEWRAKNYHPHSEAQRAKEKKTQSLDRDLSNGGMDSGRLFTGAQFAADRYGERPEDEVVRRERSELVRQALADMTELDQLTERERTVLALRFGLEGKEPMTLEEVGQVFGITKERARQIQAKALGKLRQSEHGPTLALLFSELEGLADEEQAALSEASSSGRQAPSSMLDRLAANGRKRSQMTLG